MVYVDDDFNVRGQLQVLDGPKPRVKESLVLGLTTTNDPTYTSAVVSDFLFGQPVFHSAQVYLTDFTGSVTVQATLDDTTGSSSNWADIKTVDYLGADGTQIINWEGQCAAYRFVISVEAGTVDKIVTRS